MFSKLIRIDKVMVQSWDKKDLVKEKNVSCESVGTVVGNSKVNNGDFWDCRKIRVEAGHRDVV